MRLINCCVTLLLLLFATNTEGAPVASEIQYLSPADNTMQSAMYYAHTSAEARPLVVALHTWSGNYKQKSHKDIEAWCIEKGWAYIHPDFRGPNKRPQATGSELVVEDIVSAVQHVKSTARISSVYLVGTSGGGYTALLMAGRHPELWDGVSAWVPISDLAAWYAECKISGHKYYKDIVASCGGAPGNPQTDEQYKKRSPLTWLKNAKAVNLHINAGIHDGHKGSVPISHSLLAFNEVAAEADRLALPDIRHFTTRSEVPERLRQPLQDASYGGKSPLFRRTSGKATLTIFEGGHEMVSSAAIAQLEKYESSTIPLFNGKDLTGWTALPAGEWRVENGVIRGQSAASEKRHGMLLSDKTYKDFHISLEYKADAGNSGFYFRAERVGHQVSVAGFQAEIDANGKKCGGLYETRGRAWVAAPLKDAFKKGEWNQMSVRAVGRDVTVHLNGVKTAELKNDKGRTEGHFGLQLHGGQKMDVSFRNIHIEELNAP